MFGKVIDYFGDDRGTQYIVDHLDSSHDVFAQIYEKFSDKLGFRTKPNYKHLEDSRWMILSLYELDGQRADSEDRFTYIGFCTVYNFFLYPNLIRSRISHFQIHSKIKRKIAVGGKFYNAVFDFLLASPNCVYITVERPGESFQKIRDLCDGARAYNDLQDRGIKVCPQNLQKIFKHLRKQKFCKRQAQRVFDLLNSLGSADPDQIRKDSEEIVARMLKEAEAEARGCRRMMDPKNRPTAYKPWSSGDAMTKKNSRYVQSMEWPVRKLKTCLPLISTN